METNFAYGLDSVWMAISLMVWMVRKGYFPTDVSPESITASEPSRMAFATSVTSARVGKG